MPGMIVAPEPLAVEAGAQVLQQGGNAVDAALACALVQGVVNPQMCGLGGYALANVRLAGQRETLLLDAPATAGSRFPEWRDEDLRSSLPDESLRRQMLSELRPRAHAFFAEPIAAPAGWQAGPCGVIQFTETYAGAARHAVASGWPLIRFQAGHFHMLVAAEAVAEALVQIASQWLSGNPISH
jgi:hypothetical protein